MSLDLPADQAAKYYRISRDAYDKALELAPDNQGLKAAAQFARDREASAEKLESARSRAAATYLDARRRDLGILRVAGGDFPAAFAESVGDWHTRGLPVLMSGMIGSRQGWAEAAYVPCPADTASLAALSAGAFAERRYAVSGSTPPAAVESGIHSGLNTTS